MKSKLKSILACPGLAVLTALTFTGCQSTGSGGRSNTHEMGGPGTPRMDNSLMPNRGTPGSTGSNSGSDTHDMGGLRTPRMDNSIMPGRN